jgi:hypothetical protein
MADISTPTAASKTPITDAVVRLIERQLSRLELTGQLAHYFEVRCTRRGARVPQCTVLLDYQDFAIIPEDVNRADSYA